MNSRITTVALSLFAIVVLVSPAAAQAPRTDAIWARTTTDAITLDGVLDEAAWSAAESYSFQYGVDPGIPGSGFKIEAGFPPTDPVEAEFRFLVVGDQLYMGVVVDDKSVGGSTEFNRFDGLLMAIKDHGLPGFPKPPAEYLYSWWNAEGAPDPQPVGQQPTFVGAFGSWPPSTPRDPEDIDAWDAVTIVNGQTNDDATDDAGYTIEMRFDIGILGYDPGAVGGDVIEWNVSVYDCDYFWPISVTSFAASRVWWQGPWGNASIYNEVRIHARPDVTTTSGAVPAIDPEIEIHDLGPGVTVDGSLAEAHWTDPDVYEFDIRWGDDALRETYDGVGPWRAGQYQPPVSGGEAFVADPADATVKLFTDGDVLHMGFDVRDQVVQFNPVFDRWDGFLVLINDRVERSADNELLGRRISFQVNADGTGLAQDYLSTLIDDGFAEFALSLKANTVVDTIPVSADEGYTAELAIDLKGMGYDAGLGDRVLFLGVNHLDGDSYANPADNYGTRTWWQREYEGSCCPAWIHMEPAAVSVEPGDVERPTLTSARVYPNPGQKQTLYFSLPYEARVVIEIFDVRGRRVDRQDLGVRSAGPVNYVLDAEDRSAGVYVYRLNVIDPRTGAVRTRVEGKSILMK